MTRWAPFLWLTAIVLVTLLALARLSAGVVRDGDAGGHDRPSADTDQPSTDSDRPSADALGQPRPGESVGPGASGGPADDTPTEVPTPDAVDRPAHAEPPSETPVSPGASAAHVDLSWGMLLANVALTQGLVGLVLAAGVVWFDVPLSALGVSMAPLVGGLPAVGLGLAFGLALWVGNEAAAGLADAAGAGYDEAVRSMLAPDSLQGWALLLAVVLPTVAVVEELLFRAALIGVPATATGVSPWLLAVASSVAFALGHGAQGRVGIVVTGALGLVLAGGFVLTGSLLVVVLAHYVVNALEFVVHEGLGHDRPV